MKLSLRALTLSAVAALALSGCSKNEVGDVSLGFFTLKDIKINTFVDPKVPGVTCHVASIEADIHQSIMFGLCQRLNYHVSGGTYMHQKSTYFADFKYFARRNFPDTWDDQIGGIFILLDREWFNASDKYVQTHVMYENPFLLLRLLKINSTKRFMQVASRYIMSERLYLSQLWTPVLPCYTELGYGIGNHIFNIGFFIGLDRGKYDGFGCKFAFELFQ